MPIQPYVASIRAHHQSAAVVVPSIDISMGASSSSSSARTRAPVADKPVATAVHRNHQSSSRSVAIHARDACSSIHDHMIL